MTWALAALGAAGGVVLALLVPRLFAGMPGDAQMLLVVGTMSIAMLGVLVVLLDHVLTDRATIVFTSERFEVRTPLLNRSVVWGDVGGLVLTRYRAPFGDWEAKLAVTSGPAGGTVDGLLSFFVQQLRPAAAMEMLDRFFARLAPGLVECDLVVLVGLLRRAEVSGSSSAPIVKWIRSESSSLMLYRAAADIRRLERPLDGDDASLAAGILLMVGDAPGALACAESVLSAQPDDFESLVVRGLCLRDIAGPAAAIPVLRRAAVQESSPRAAIVAAEADRLAAMT
jgi:hypothetical protein